MELCRRWTLVAIEGITNIHFARCMICNGLQREHVAKSPRRGSIVGRFGVPRPSSKRDT
jgi:hypothetical protein